MAELRVAQDQFKAASDDSNTLVGAVGELEVLLEVGTRGPAGKDGQAEAIEQIDCGTF